MNLSEELRLILKKYGYSITLTAEKLIIKSKNYSSFIVTGLMVIGGLILILLAGDPIITAFAVILIGYPILTFRRNSSEIIALYSDKSVVKSHSRGLLPLVNKYSFNDFQIEVYTYSRLSYTNAMEEGNKEYFADINLVFSSRNKVELFHFSSRDENKLNFIPSLVKQMESILHQLTRSTPANTASLGNSSAQV